MDGNGRWAQQRGLSPRQGHKAGAKAVRTVMQQCLQLKIPALTVFVFSTENWKRSKWEVAALMRLIEDIIKVETAELRKNGIRVNIMGNRSQLPDSLVGMIERVEEETQNFSRLYLNVALNYGAQEELAEAALSAGVSSENDSIEAKKDLISRKLGLAKLPLDFRDPDLLIRTGGEMRLSNFLLWNLAYTELYFTPVMWPDFGIADFRAALQEYQQRNRRFGARLHVPMHSLNA